MIFRTIFAGELRTMGYTSGGNYLINLGDCLPGQSKFYEVYFMHLDGVLEFYSHIVIGKFSGSEENVTRVHNFYGEAKLFKLKGTDSIYLHVPSYRHIRYRLLQGSDITHDLIKYDAESMSDYEEIPKV